ncbi:hypothetical protein PVA38_10995 [Streptococcus pneumoniae D39]|nr:hypothetical protein PVA38_10995 [Streptococcus pneumoniae D39]
MYKRQVGGYALGSTLMNDWAAALPEILPNFMQNMVGMIVAVSYTHLTLPTKLEV